MKPRERNIKGPESGHTFRFDMEKSSFINNIIKVSVKAFTRICFKRHSHATNRSSICKFRELPTGPCGWNCADINVVAHRSILGCCQFGSRFALCCVGMSRRHIHLVTPPEAMLPRGLDPSHSSCCMVTGISCMGRQSSDGRGRKMPFK